MNGARILVAPLDWGLGHAARCVPVVQALLARGAVPVIAADKGPLALLRSEFPELDHVRLPGISIRYSKGGSQLLRMALQFPAMVRQVQAEQRAFERLRRVCRIDAVITDQRFGVRATDLPSVLITHQVFPFTPVAQGALRKVNLRHIERFHRCWVMDEPGAEGLAGELSHPAGARGMMPVNARYIGTLSRLRPADGLEHDVVAVISGPEPQRTLFEREIISALSGLPGRHVLVRGLPHMEQEAGEERIGNVQVMAHADAVTLQGLLTGARAIVSRSGYTTLMDLAALGRSAIVVPTPGQEEQEYLGRLHSRTGRFAVQQQGHLDLSAEVLGRVSGKQPVTASDMLLQHALDDLRALLR